MAENKKDRALATPNDPERDGSQRGVPNSCHDRVGHNDELLTSEPDAIEAALAAALNAATAAGQWEVVSQVTHELEARRESRAT